ncbi:MAG: radical SAM protein, partial [Candidatus Altiarchaeales archaeon]
YRPEYKAFRFEDINRRLSYDEFLTALNYGKKLNLLIAD